METSILNSVKKVLGLSEEYEAFDPDVLMHINTVFSTLHQLGIGPDEGFMVEDKSATWTDFLAEDHRYNSIKTYTYLRVRMLFDPPATSFAQTSMMEQIKEFEWRLNVIREGDTWRPPSRSSD